MFIFLIISLLLVSNLGSDVRLDQHNLETSIESGVFFLEHVKGGIITFDDSGRPLLKTMVKGANDSLLPSRENYEEKVFIFITEHEELLGVVDSNVPISDYVLKLRKHNIPFKTYEDLNKELFLDNYILDYTPLKIIEEECENFYGFYKLKIKIKVMEIQEDKFPLFPFHKGKVQCIPKSEYIKTRIYLILDILWI